MAVTLAQAKIGVPDALSKLVIDEFMKGSFLMQALQFEDAVTPVGGGATLTYGYTRVTTTATAAFRALNSEYSAQEAVRSAYNVTLKPFGGKFSIDRVINSMGGIQKESEFQMKQKIKAAVALFNNTVINGDTGVDANAFDGLEKAIVGSSTELKPNSATTCYLDLSTDAAMESNKWIFIDYLDEMLSLLDGKPDFLGVNTKMFNKIKSVARRAGYLTKVEDAFGKPVDAYNNIPIVDLGQKTGTNDPVIDIETRDADGAGAGGNITGLTDIYAVRVGLDGFHAVSLAGQPPVRQWMPDYTTAGAVKDGEVEMVAAVALKATKAAGMLRNIKVQ